MKFNLKLLLTIISIIVIPIAIIVYFIKKNGPEHFFSSLLTLNLWWIAGALLLMFIYWVADSLIANYFCRFLGYKLTFWKTFENTMIGQFFNSVTPFATGGQPMQTYHLVSSAEVPLGTATSTMVLKFIVFQTTVTLYSAIVLLLKLGFFLEKIPHIIILSAVGFCLNTFIIIVCFIFCYKRVWGERIVSFFVKLLQRFRLIKKSKDIHQRIDAELELFYNCYILVRKKFKIWFITGLLTILQLTVFYMVTFFIYMAFNNIPVQGDLTNIVSAQAFVQMVISIIPIPGGSGGAEGTFYLFFKLFFSVQSIALAVFLWRIITYYSCLAIGGLVTLIPILKSRRFKNL